MGRRAKNGLPKIVLLKCDECGHPVGNRGYLAVDRVSAMERRAGVERNGSHRPGGVTTLDRQIFWRIVHTGCDVTPKSSDYRIPTRLFTTTGDLLEATAHLMRSHPWVIETNWSGLIGRVLADTRRNGETEKPATITDRPNGAQRGEGKTDESDKQEGTDDD
jgi:hypothetical protein